MIRRLLLVASVLLPAAMPALALPPFLDGAASRRLDFDIIRHGETIGSHSMAFSTRQGVTEVEFKVRVRVKILSITAYRYDQHGVEVWDGDRLTSLSADTDDDGDVYKVRAERHGDRLRVTSNDTVAEYSEMPVLNLWRVVPPQASQVLDPTDGKPTPIAAADNGWETITVRGNPVRAQRWTWDGDLKRQLWYDDSGRLLQVHVKGSDGSDIYYVLKEPANLGR
ncbi:DUF6134 family protein [Magnetospirillum sp. SS-4]|uniref:DUF6134 family protein n=1 Tax=Magnetospirillum sp. SS-4 TaxID=2681465 RepID=UPI001572A24B|nr:DUF6134 family protein [Magnetospirillum sp. SS-4]